MARVLKGLLAFYLLLLTLYVILRFTVGDGFWWLSLLNTFAFLLFVPLPLALLGAWLQKTHWLRWFSIALLAVALVWFGQYFLPKSPRNAQGETIKVLTYNMQAKDEGLESFLQNTQPDIVFLQEISSALASSESMNELYPYQFAQPEQWGNKVLSKYPILKAEDLQGFGSSLPQRLELDVNGKTIAVYNIHLTWPIGNPRLNVRFLPGFIAKAISGFDDSQRNAQIDLLIDHLEKEPLPYLVAGDFNVSQYSATYGKLSRIAGDSFRESATGFGNTWPATMQSGLNLPPLLRLDYVWHSVHFSPQTAKREKALAGDHFPLTVNLVLEDLTISAP
jgi:endonuclease/exonuclease/phosphatase family metal-dependent hydrolase